MTATQAIRSAEWRRANEASKYPFSDRATLVNEEGTFIPESLFLDAILHPIGGTQGFYLSQVDVTNETATIYIGDENSPQLAFAVIDIIEPPDNVPLVDIYDRAAGTLVSESIRLSTFQSWALGTHTFDVDQTEFVARVCVPMPALGVLGFLLDDGTVVSGDVWLIGEDGVVLTGEASTERVAGSDVEQQAITAIRVDVVGDPLFRRRLCGGVFETPRVLEQLTVRAGGETIYVGPNDLGDVQITAGDQDVEDPILRIRGTPEGVIFEVVGERLEAIR